ncbi:Cytochrome c oxidase polypeptide I [Streptomyces misionensis JCM 4497]
MADDHRSQDDRHAVPGDVVRVLPPRRSAGAHHARRTRPARTADRLQGAVQPGVHHARHDHAADVRDAPVLRLHQLDHAAADRRPRRGVPAAEHVRLLAVPVRLADRGGRLHHPGRCGRLRLVRLCPAAQRGVLARCRRERVVHGSGLLGLRDHPRLGQLHHHDHLHARPGHDDVPDADLRVERAADQRPGPVRLPGAGRRALRCRGGPHLRVAHLRRGQRRRPAVAAPLLVLRPPRGVHHRAAVLRHRLRGHPGLLAQADVRLHGPDRGDDLHRGAVHHRVGAPHVRHRRGAAAVLLLHVLPDRGTDRGEVLQLDRHDVEGLAVLRDADAVVGGLSRHVPLRRSDRGAPSLPADGLPRLRLVLRGGPLPLRGLRYGRVRHVRRLPLLVAEVHRQDAGRAPRQDHLLDAVRRLPHHLPGAALAGRRGHAAPLRRLPGGGRLHHAEHGVHHRFVPAGPVDAAVPLQRLEDRPVRRAGRRGRPVGLRPFPGVGDVLPAAAPQLPDLAAGPQRVPGVRPAPPRHRARRGRGPQRVLSDRGLR